MSLSAWARRELSEAGWTNFMYVRLLGFLFCIWVVVCKLLFCFISVYLIRTHTHTHTHTWVFEFLLWKKIIMSKHMLQSMRPQKTLGKAGFQRERLRVHLLYSMWGSQVQRWRPCSPMCSLHTRASLGQALCISVTPFPPQENGNNNHAHFLWIDMNASWVLSGKHLEQFLAYL